jgi:hypothetical protein
MIICTFHEIIMFCMEYLHNQDEFIDFAGVSRWKKNEKYDHLLNLNYNFPDTARHLVFLSITASATVAKKYLNTSFSVTQIQRVSSVLLSLSSSLELKR